MSKLSWVTLLTSACLTLGVFTPAFCDYAEDIPTTLKRYEMELFGQVKSGSILDRIKALEKDLWKKPQDGTLPERLDRIGQMLRRGASSPSVQNANNNRRDQDRSAFQNTDGALPPPAPVPTAPPPPRPQTTSPPSARNPAGDSKPMAPADKQRTASQLLEQAMDNFKSGNPAEAQRLFSAVLNLDPNNTDALYNLGVIAETRKDYATARNYYQKALRNSPGDKDLSDAVKQMDRYLSTPAYAPR